jgi:outer membrane protein assembly factor BamB
VKLNPVVSLCLLTALFAGISTPDYASAGDWAYWRGPDYNAISKETAFDPAALNANTKPVWQAEIGVGFSAVTVADGKAYTAGNVDKKTDVIHCFDAVTGKVIWTHRYAESLNPKYYEGGTSATPTIADGKVYTISKTGKIFCLNADTGDIIWTVQAKAKEPTWGFAGSAVIQDNMAIFNVGDAGLALNKDDGSVIWQNGSGPAAYASAVPYVVGGKKCLAILGAKYLFGVDAATGKQLWKSEWETQYDVNASDPIISDDLFFVTSGYGHGCGLVKVTDNAPVQLWTNKDMRSQISGPVLLNGYLYGIDENQLVCMELMTGAVKWTEKKIGKGALTAADGKLIVLGEKGTLYIANASPQSFDVISSAQILSGKCWTVPILANGRIYARSAKGDLVCIDVRKKVAIASLPNSPAPDGSTDWPQFRGPNRDGKSTETGLLKKWPDGGPKMLWSVDGLGSGYSTVAVSNGTMYTTGMVDGKGVLFAFDTNGKPKWKQTYGPEWRKSMPSVRCTPTVDGDRVYVISGVGEVFCYDAKSGERKWTVDAFGKFGGEYGIWGIAESPLIDGNNVICTPGGKQATVAALDKMTGETVWTCLVEGEKSCYCSPILVQRGPNRIIVTMTDVYVLGIDAKTGKLLWKDSQADQFGHNKEINPVSPISYEGAVYATSGYDDGGAMLLLNSDGTAVTRKWVDTTLDCHHGGVVIVDGHIYGANWADNGNGSWVCLDWQTGKVKYETHWNCKGAVTYADGMLYCYEEKGGNIALVRAVPDKFDIVSFFKVPLGDGKHWAHPVVCGGVLYIRHGDALMAYDIREG